MKFVINLLLLLAISQTQAETALRFRSHISPEARYMSDVLQITPDKNHWGKIMLNSQPADGQRIEKNQIIAWLQHKVGAFNYHWQGKNTATVHQITHTKAGELINKARRELAKKLSQQAYTHIDLKSHAVLKDSDIALTNFKVTIQTSYPVAKRVCVHLNYKERSIPIWFTVKAYQKVLVANRRIKRFTVLRKNDVSFKKRNIAGIKNSPLLQFPANVWLKKGMNKNQILSEDNLSALPEVIQGQQVKVQVQQFGVSVVVEALAQSNGHQGEVIRLKNPSTNKYFTATITGKNTAEVVA